MINVLDKAVITSSAAAAGTSTTEYLKVISMAPICRPDRLVSLAIAPTRSCGRTLAEWPRLTKIRVVSPPPVPRRAGSRSGA